MKDETSSRQDQAAPAFIVGMPRAATRWLCRCLNAHSDAAAFGETLFWGRRYVSPGPGGRYTAEQLHEAIDHLRSGFCVTRYSDDRPGSLRHVRDTNFADLLDSAFADVTEDLTPGETFLRITNAIRDTEYVQLVVEKTPHHLNWIDRIIQELPSARFIIMTREPYSFMLSYKHQGDRMKEQVRKSFERRYHPIAAAVVWRGSMISALTAVERWPKQTLLISHEALRETPDEVLRAVQEFLDLPVQPLAQLVPPVNSSFPDGKRPELAPDDIFWMNRVAGRLMDELNLARKPTPRQLWPILRSFIVLPLWAVRNVISMKQIVHGSIFAYFWRWLRPKQSRDSHRKSKESPVAGSK